MFGHSKAFYFWFCSTGIPCISCIVWIETIDIQIKKSRFRKHFFQRLKSKGSRSTLQGFIMVWMSQRCWGHWGFPDSRPYPVGFYRCALAENFRSQVNLRTRTARISRIPVGTLHLSTMHMRCASFFVGTRFWKASQDCHWVVSQWSTPVTANRWHCLLVRPWKEPPMSRPSCVTMRPTTVLSRAYSLALQQAYLLKKFRLFHSGNAFPTWICQPLRCHDFRSGSLKLLERHCVLNFFEHSQHVYFFPPAARWSLEVR